MNRRDRALDFAHLECGCASAEYLKSVMQEYRESEDVLSLADSIAIIGPNYSSDERVIVQSCFRSPSLKTTSASDRPPLEGFRSARASNCELKTSLPKADWTTLVRSKQSMQLTRKTPFCWDITIESDTQKNLQGNC